MFNGTVLDVAVGLIFVFLMLSVACSLVNERIQSFFDRRAKMLQVAIEGLLGPEAKDLIAHPLIQALSQGEGGLPSYIPSTTFAVALLESLVHKAGDTATTAPMSFARVKAAVDDHLPADSQTRRALQALLSTAHGDMTKMRVSVEHWFDSSMERLSGTYKRHINRWLLGLGFVLALITNADAIRLIQRLEHESTLRALVTAQAKLDAAGPAPGAPAAPVVAAESAQDSKLVAMRDQLGKLDLLFWDIDHLATEKQVDKFPRALLEPAISPAWFRWLLFKLIGCAMTALAVSLGAPFWFDLLGRLVNLRATGEKPPRTSDALPMPPPPSAVAVASVAEATSTTTTTTTATPATGASAPALPADTAAPAKPPSQ
jgi:hypothetical protein